MIKQYFITFWVLEISDQRHVGPFSSQRKAAKYLRKIRTEHKNILDAKIDEPYVIDELHSPNSEWWKELEG